MSFHYRLKHLRTLNGQTQSELAEILGLKSTTIANYESNRNEPSFDKLIALSKHFEVTSDYLLGISEDCCYCCMSSIHKRQYSIHELCKKLNDESIHELKTYMDYLIYKQEHNPNGSS